MMRQDSIIVGLVKTNHPEGGKEGYLFIKFERI